MLNGSQLLQSFDESLASAEQQASAAQAELDRLSARLDALRTAEAQALRELARLRLDMLGKDGGAAVERLDAASARARAVLEERARAAATAEEELAGKRRALEEATAARDREARRLQEAEETAKREAAAARERLAEDPEWVRLRDAAAEAARVAEHARQKADFALRDRDEKGRPYMEDPLFAYLWRRGYGTAEYRAGGFTRLMDGFVARVARYEPARRSYALLTELPERLAGHASRMRLAAEEQAAAFGAYERRIVTGQAGGELPAIRSALERAEDAVETAHAALDETERRHAALADENAGRREAWRCCNPPCRSRACARCARRRRVRRRCRMMRSSRGWRMRARSARRWSRSWPSGGRRYRRHGSGCSSFSRCARRCASVAMAAAGGISGTARCWGCCSGRSWAGR